MVDSHRIEILIESLFKDEGFVRAEKKLVKLRNLSQKVSTQFRRGFQTITDTTEKVLGGFKRFPAHMLSIMFLGWQLKRTFLGFLESATATYMKITEGQTAAGKAMLKFQAAWEFFKFSVLEALAPLIEFFATLVANIVDFVSQHPMLMKIIAGFILLGAVLGVLLATFGSLGAGIWGVIKLFETLGITGCKTFTLVKAGLGAVIPKFLAWIPVIAFVAYFMYRLFKNATAAIRMDQKAKLAAMKGDWKSFSVFVMARNILLKYALIKTFADIAYQAGYLVWEAARTIIQAIGWVAGLIKPEWAEPFERANQYILDMHKRAAESMARNYETLNAMATQELTEMGVPMEDIIDAMYAGGASTESLIQGFAAAGRTTEEITLAFSHYRDKLEETTEQVWYFNDSIEETVKQFKEKLSPQLLEFSEVTAPKAAEQTDILIQKMQAWRAETQGVIDKLNELNRMSVSPKINIPSVPAIPAIQPRLPFFQAGGFVKRTGLAVLHAGETVLPAGAAPINISFAPVYNISGVGSEEELRRILEEHDRELMLEISRLKIPGV